MVSDENENTVGIPLRTCVRWADHVSVEDPNYPDYEKYQEKFGITPLHQAAYNNSIKKVKKLLDEHVDVNVTDKQGWRPLHDAAMKGNVEIVKLLLAAGADPNVQDDEMMYTPLHDAVRMNHPEVVKLLLKSGADRSIKNTWDETPLDIAQEYKFQEIVDLLSR